jgi:HEAT repeat protein
LPLVDYSQVRRDAASLLGGMGSLGKPAVPSLIRALKKDDDVFVRALAAQALGNIGKGDRTVVEALTEARRDRSIPVCLAASAALLQADPEAAAKAGVTPRSGPNALPQIDPEAAAKTGVKALSP